MRLGEGEDFTPEPRLGLGQISGHKRTAGSDFHGYIRSSLTGEPEQS